MALIDVIGWVGKRRWARPVGVPMMLAARRIPLATIVRLAGRRICIPSAGYSAIALSGTSVRDNLLDGSLMYQTLAGAIERFGLEADGTVSDLTIEPQACGCPVTMPDHDTPYVSEHPYFPEYKVKFSHENLACDLTFENLLPGWTRGSGEIMFGREEKHQLFGWVVAQPRAKVTGTLSVDGVDHQVSGIGYHDHNWGSGLLPMYVSHWIWGRLSTDRVTMIFADISTTRKCGGVRVPLVFLALDDKIVLESARADCRASRYVTDREGFRVYPSHVDFEFAERDVAGEFHFDVTREIEAVNMLAQKLPGPLADAFSRLVAAPAYYRFLSDFSGKLRVGDEELDLGGETHWEYMVMNLRRGKVPGPAHKINI